MTDRPRRPRGDPTGPWPTGYRSRPDLYCPVCADMMVCSDCQREDNIRWFRETVGYTPPNTSPSSSPKWEVDQGEDQSASSPAASSSTASSSPSKTDDGKDAKNKGKYKMLQRIKTTVGQVADGRKSPIPSKERRQSRTGEPSTSKSTLTGGRQNISAPSPVAGYPKPTDRYPRR